MADSTWPPALKDWVGKNLAQMNESNRMEAQTEMKQLIGHAFNNAALWTTDWPTIKLKALQPKAPPVISLKRKTEAPASLHVKKAKSAHVVGTSKMLTPSTGNVFDVPRYDPDAVAKARRAQRFEREHELDRQRTTAVPPAASATMSSLAARMGGPPPVGFVPAKVKWGGKTASKRAMYGHFQAEDVGENGESTSMDWDAYKIVGRSQEIFKRYLRLTSEPDPATIRPKHILEETLRQLKARWRQEQNYQWACDQLKSLRQDLTVQRIKDEFTVSVYEIHARMALESNDLVEFNACLATLPQFYETGIRGKNDEFLAYRILFLVHAKNRSEINRLIGQLNPSQKNAAPVAHALQVQRAVSSNNYHALFALYNQAPNMGAYIMDHFVARERVSALLCMSKAFKPSLPLEFLASELSFDSLEEADKFLAEHNASIYTDPRARLEQRMLDMKMASPALAAAFETKYRKVNIRGVV